MLIHGGPRPLTGELFELREALVHQQLVNRFPGNFRKVVLTDFVKYKRENMRDTAGDIQ
jgi:hypothetical protein